MTRTPSKLFHAVVITGAALTACAGPARTGTSTNASTTSTEANSTSKKGPDTANKGGTCPPGSERPFPPCYWIK